jgi:uncharacterized membrane protein YfcA
VLGIQVAAPLVALFAVVAETALVIYYRSALEVGVVWRLVIASVLGVPLGVIALRSISEQVVLTILGLVVAGYALYMHLKFRLPLLKRPVWAYIAGFLAGVLGGAYNISGPPVIVYGNACRWPPPVFKSNLQGFFVLNSLVILVSHLLAGNYTSLVLRNGLVALPAVALGIWAGLRLDKRLSPQIFRQLVLWLLLLLGVWLIIAAW